MSCIDDMHDVVCIGSCIASGFRPHSSPLFTTHIPPNSNSFPLHTITSPLLSLCSDLATASTRVPCGRGCSHNRRVANEISTSVRKRLDRTHLESVTLIGLPSVAYTDKVAPSARAPDTSVSCIHTCPDWRTRSSKAATAHMILDYTCAHPSASSKRP
jgi:hypothetical protein